jgi:hypothetical protein
MLGEHHKWREREREREREVVVYLVGKKSN